MHILKCVSWGGTKKMSPKVVAGRNGGGGDISWRRGVSRDPTARNSKPGLSLAMQTGFILSPWGGGIRPGPT